MKSRTLINNKVDIDISNEVLLFAFRTVATAGAVIGTWALCCIGSALLSQGPLNMLRGYITAMTGF